MDAIRAKIRRKFGVDPLSDTKTAAQKYVDYVCKGLPPKNSEEREALRKTKSGVSADMGIHLDEYFRINKEVKE